MTTREQQVRNSVIYLLPVVVASAVPLLTLPVYTRLLTAQDFGAWALCLAYAMFLTGLANFGLTIGYERNFFEHPEPDGRARLLYSTLAFVLVAFVLCTTVTWAFRERIAAALPEDKRTLIVELADNHARHVWLQQEGAYHMGLAVGRRMTR